MVKANFASFVNAQKIPKNSNLGLYNFVYCKKMYYRSGEKCPHIMYENV